MSLDDSAGAAADSLELVFTVLASLAGAGLLVRSGRFPGGLRVMASVRSSRLRATFAPGTSKPALLKANPQEQLAVLSGTTLPQFGHPLPAI